MRNQLNTDALLVTTASSRQGCTSTRGKQVRIEGLHVVQTHSEQIRRGFTMIETFVAISILLVSLAGPLSIAAQSLRAAHYARDQVTAFYLAQEGIEYVRGVRDQNYLATPPNEWLAGLSSGESSCMSPALCNIDFQNFTHQVCSGSCSPLLLSASQIFNTQTGTPTLYTRTLTILPVAGTSDEVEVQVTISWISAGINRSFQLTEHIFNWL